MQSTGRPWHSLPEIEKRYLEAYQALSPYIEAEAEHYADSYARSKFSTDYKEGYNDAITRIYLRIDWCLYKIKKELLDSKEFSVTVEASDNLDLLGYEYAVKILFKQDKPVEVLWDNWSKTGLITILKK
ncbi:MAG: hypothetical protein H0V82_08540 [Candidatus Protochlamydia sp.]|nr:hypothetical protein [Candidatus Protochlamydia sp.]